jgi:hypothetical protein
MTSIFIYRISQESNSNFNLYTGDLHIPYTTPAQMKASVARKIFVIINFDQGPYFILSLSNRCHLWMQIFWKWRRHQNRKQDYFHRWSMRLLLNLQCIERTEEPSKYFSFWLEICKTLLLFQGYKRSVMALVSEQTPGTFSNLMHDVCQLEENSAMTDDMHQKSYRFLFEMWL